MTVSFSVQTKTLLRVKGGVTNKEPGTTGVTWGCSGHVTTLVMKILSPQTGCEEATGTKR